MADGTDEDGARATRMGDSGDEGEIRLGGIKFVFMFSLSILISFVRGARTLRRTAEGGGSPMPEAYRPRAKNLLCQKLTGRGTEAGSLC
jgi:hypothetical protein